MAHRHKHHAKGGHVQKEVNSKVEDEAESKHDGFKRGGKMKKHAAGGKVVGRAQGGRLDKRARGGGTHSPFSSAHIKGGHGPAHNPHPHKG